MCVHCDVQRRANWDSWWETVITWLRVQQLFSMFLILNIRLFKLWPNLKNFHRVRLQWTLFFLITNGTASAQAIIYNKYTHILKKKKNSGSIVLWFTHSSGRASGESAKSNMGGNLLWWHHVNEGAAKSQYPLVHFVLFLARLLWHYCQYSFLPWYWFKTQALLLNIYI